MLFQGIVQSLCGSPKASGNPNVSQGYSAELLLSELYPQLYYLTKNNKVYFQQVTAANPTAFTGGAAGTPLIGVYNPVGSGVDCVILSTRIGVRTQGTAAGAYDAAWYGGVSVLPTGTNTVPINAYSQQATGSAMKSYVNTAMTGSTAVTLTAPIVGLGANPGTTAPATVAVVNDAPNGVVIASPGVLQALGVSFSGTAGSFDVAVYWAELPV